MNSNIQQIIEKRRSIYAIGKEVSVPKADLQQLVENAVKHVPSAFNSQSARVVVLFNEQHDKLWEIVRETLRRIVPEENFASTDEKINSFQNGFGTVLYFEDQGVVEGLQQQFPLYKDVFPVWSLQSSGMLQYTIWNLLAEVDLGASLQHYNPLIDEQVKVEWNLPLQWKLLAQMPFGNIVAAAGEKEFAPLDSRVKVFS